MKKKRMIPLLIVVVVAVVFTFSTPYKCIKRHVTQNQSNLTLASEFYLEQGEVNKAGNDRVDVDGIYGDTNTSRSVRNGIDTWTVSCRV